MWLIVKDSEARAGGFRPSMFQQMCLLIFCILLLRLTETLLVVVRGPGDEIITKVEIDTRGGATSVRQPPQSTSE